MLVSFFILIKIKNVLPDNEKLMLILQLCKNSYCIVATLGTIKYKEFI